MDNLDRSIGFYIHIPFCKSKCHYCDFNSFAGMEDYIKPYFKALKHEIESYEEELRGCTVNTIYIGGGTPSSVDASYIYEVINTCAGKFNLRKGMEISVEANPGTLSYDKVLDYRDVGINRLSIGLQAWQSHLLRYIGRIHSAGEFVESFELARKAGFENINVDLMFSLPGQSINDWHYTLERVAGIEPEHISCYGLKIEEGTPFGERLDSGELILIDDESDREMYYLAIDILRKKGFKHYEISNFAQPGFECGHNLIYWNAEPYIGVGAGAHSYFQGKRFNNLYKINDYISALSRQEGPSENVQIIDRKESIKEYMILRLRLIDGIDADEFEKRFGENIFKLFARQFDRLLKRGLLESDGKLIKLSPLGLDLANQVFLEFI